MVYAFYLLGVLMRRRGVLIAEVGKPILAVGAAAALAGVYFTYDLNQGPFNLIPAVVIVTSGHGHLFWFPLTAIVGSAMVRRMHEHPDDPAGQAEAMTRELAAGLPKTTGVA